MILPVYVSLELSALIEQIEQLPDIAAAVSVHLLESSTDVHGNAIPSENDSPSKRHQSIMIISLGPS